MAGDSLKSVNPYTEDTIAEYELFSDRRIDETLDRAVDAQETWKASAMQTRAATLRALASRLETRRDELAELATREMGKLIGEARGEVEKCAWVCRYYADNAERQLADEPLADDGDKKSFVARSPLGVILTIMPWNFPYWQAFRCAAPALMAGNTVVLKHASNVTGCAMEMQELFAETGASDGLFQTIVCSGSRASELIGDDRIAGASLTGSERAGRSVGAAAGEAIKPSVLELGGSDPFVVLDLENEAKVLDNAVQARYMNSGQSCIAAKRFIVLEDCFDRFVEGFVEGARERRFGDPREEDTTLAPMARDDLRDEIAEQVEDAVANG
ncbi:MAG: aldehyde dehydrogenase family protein, partial [Xanthomonadales bacterium]|nr:aldehyde dehydrogenase family protein [Xanthomonadales bacterium]